MKFHSGNTGRAAKKKGGEEKKQRERNMKREANGEGRQEEGDTPC